MTSNSPLSRLVMTSMARRTNKKLFASLLVQLNDRDPIADPDISDCLLELNDKVKTHLTNFKATENLQIEYALEYAFSKSENMATFFRLLPKLSYLCQSKYVLYLKSHSGAIFKRTLLRDFLDNLAKYTEALASSLSASSDFKGKLLKIWYNLVFLWLAIIESSPSSVSIVDYKALFATIIAALNTLEEKNLSTVFSSKLGSLAYSADLPNTAREIGAGQLQQDSALSVAKSHLSLNLGSRKLSGYVELKKFVWLNSQFSSWKSHANILPKFIAYFRIPTKNHKDLIHVILDAFFTGISLAIQSKEKPYVIFNWKNFIASRLPSAIKRILSSSDFFEEDIRQEVISFVANIEDPIITQMTFGSRETYNLSKDFLKSCLYRKVVLLEDYTKLHPPQYGSETFSASFLVEKIEQLDQVDGLAQEIKAKIEDVNTEFTSLEESKLVEFFQKLPSTDFAFSEAQQTKFSEVINNLFDKLILEKNNEKLSRLTLALSNALMTSNILFYNDPLGPWTILKKIITYIDHDSFTFDDDDENFQDIYASFGIILSGVVSIAYFFGIDLSSINIRDSFAIDYINTFFCRSCDNFTSVHVGRTDEEELIASNFDKLFTEWANALFDVNNDGLSDDLIKSVDVKQIYKFIFLLFRQAFTARAVGSLSVNSVNNGIDYLSQNFLVPCSLEIMRWTASNIGPKYSQSQSMIEILLKIVEGNMDADSPGSTGHNYVFRMIIRIVGAEIMTRLKYFNNKNKPEGAQKLFDILKREIDKDYCVLDYSPMQSASGMSSVMGSIKEEVLRFLKEPSLVEVKDLSSIWQKLNGLWAAISPEAIAFTLLQETERCINTRSSLVKEESKLLVDFFTFMAITSSSPDVEECVNFESILKSATKLELGKALDESKFSITMDNHLSAIFNVTSKPEAADVPREEQLQPKQEFMSDLDMDGLFDDMPDALFDDPMNVSKQNTQTPPATEEPGYANIIKVFHMVRSRTTPLAYAVRKINSENYEKDHGNAAEMAKWKVSDELQRWRVSMEV